MDLCCQLVNEDMDCAVDCGNRTRELCNVRRAYRNNEIGWIDGYYEQKREEKNETPLWTQEMLNDILHNVRRAYRNNEIGWIDGYYEQKREEKNE